jgi:hypothetical protein
MDEKKTINVVCEEESTLDRIKRMAKKARNKVLDGIEYAIDHPVETTAKIGAVTVLANQVGKLAGAVTRPAREAKENRRYYDRFNSCRYIDTRRRLTSREEQELDMYVRSGGYAYDWLKQRRLLK